MDMQTGTRTCASLMYFTFDRVEVEQVSTHSGR